MLVKVIMDIVTVTTKILAHEVLPDLPDRKAWTVKPRHQWVRKENQVQLEHRFPCHRCPLNRVEFVRVDRKASMVQQVPVDRRDQKDKRVRQEKSVAMVMLDRVDLLDRLVMRAVLVKLVPKVHRAVMLNVEIKVQPDLQAKQEMLAVLVVMEKKEPMVVRVQQADLVQPVLLAQQENQPRTVHQDQKVNQEQKAKMLNIVHVQVIRRNMPRTKFFCLFELQFIRFCYA